MRYVLPVLFLVLLLQPACAEELIDEAWERVYIQGAHAGYGHQRVVRVDGEGGPRIVTHTDSEVTMNRMGTLVTVQSSSVTWESPTGRLLRIESTSTMSNRETKTVYRFETDGVKVSTTTMGSTRDAEIAHPAGVTELAGPWAVAQKTKKLAGTKGESFKAWTFVGDLGVHTELTVTSFGQESVELRDGTTPELTRVQTLMSRVPMKPDAWLRSDGTVEKSKIVMLGLVIEGFHVADEAAAKAKEESAKPRPDLFQETLIAEKGPVPVPRKLEAATILLHPKSADAKAPELPASGFTVETLEDGSVRIQARRVVPAAGKTGVRPLADPPEALADALASSSLIQADAQPIQDIATKTVGEERDAWRAAQRLERWVFDNLTKKGFGVGFASALEVCEDRAGDCTEHAVLLAALCRAAGIPARVVMGFEYLMGIWGGHAWNEVWIDGAWYPLDATNGYGFVDPLHVPLAHMTLKEGGAGEEFMGLLGQMGSFEIDVVEVTHAGRTIAVNDASLVETKDRTYRDRVWGIAFEAPAGFAFDPPAKRALNPKLIELDGQTAGGKQCEISIVVLDTPPSAAWPDLLRFLQLKAPDVAKTEVDGREARRRSETTAGRHRVRVVVPVGDALFLFQMTNVEGPPEQQAFDAFLGSVDFDVR